jgi:hypothetical protein
MDDTRPTLPQRVTAVLRARQYVVFFAIVLYTLDLAVPLTSAWLLRRQALPQLLERFREPLADAVAGRSVPVAGLFLVALFVTTWLRAGYIRSLVGRFRLGPAGTRQFLDLLALETLLALAGGAAALWTAGGLAQLAVLALYVVALYADYIIVIAGCGPVAALQRSWRTVRATPLPSLAILLAVTLFGVLASGLPGDAADGGLASALPLFVVRCVLMGAVVFVADVALVVLYLETAAEGGADDVS